MATSNTGSKKGQTKNTGTGKKKTTPAPKGNTRTNTRTYSKKKNKMIQEAAILISMALCIIFFLANFGVGGVVGHGISSFFFGLFGLISYLFPILLFFVILFAISNKNNSVARVKIIAAVFAMIFLCTIIQLISGNHATGENAWKVADYYTNSSHDKNGGGLFGGMLCKLFCTWFGIAGAYIFSIVLLIIAAVVITEHSFITGVKKGGKKVYDTAKKDMREYRAEVAIKNRERQAKELAAHKEAKPLKRGKGVTFNTKIDDTSEPEPVYNFEKANSKAEKEEEIVPFNEADYEKVTDATDYAMRHFQDEQSIPFEPAYDERIIIEEEIPRQEIKKTEPEPVVEDNNETIDMELVRKEFEKEHLIETKNISENKPETKTSSKETKAPTEEGMVMSTHTNANKNYKFPPLSLLKKSNGAGNSADGKDELRTTAAKLQQTLATFGVKVTVTDASRGPAVTRYELQPEQGVKVSKIVSLADDIKLNLAAADIRIEAPIPGKAAVGIEVPNRETTGVMLGDLIASKQFKESDSKIAFAAGKDIAGQTIMADIAKMPHLLIAGATGSGKSVCINTIVMSILYRAKPEEVKLIMVDPKVVELNVYNGIPHLLTPVVTDPKKAAAALNWAVQEMMKRYKLFADYDVRNMQGYNEKVPEMEPDEFGNKPEKLPQIVIIVDELADLMMVASNEVEDAIVRLAQLARAAGIHLIIATQRPSVNVITGLIKANVPSRIAFAVSSGVDSRTILDMVGAEKLLGKGDMLFYPQGYQKPARVQGAFVSDSEVADVVAFLKSNNQAAEYNESVSEHLSNPGFEESQTFGGDQDSYFADAGRLIIEKERASIGALQRVFKVGFNRAARIMDQLCEAGVVGGEEGTKPRKILMTMEEFEEYLRNNQN